MCDSGAQEQAASASGDSQRRAAPRSRTDRWPWLATVGVMAVSVLQLHRQGRLWWCSCGQLYLWSGDSRGPYNSQPPFDPYSFTHVLHGLLYCGLLAWGIPRWSPAWRLWLALSIEAVWEVLENSDFIIQRYRAETIALGYQGDTIANSLGDILSCGIGFALARRLGLRGSLALFVVIEAVLLLWIRDSLLVNVVMLIHPIEAIKAWQMGH